MAQSRRLALWLLVGALGPIGSAAVVACGSESPSAAPPASTTTAPTSAAVPVNPGEVRAWLAAHPGAVVVDVRTADEYAQGHLANARNLDVTQPGFDAAVAALGTDTPVLVYCHSGRRSAVAAARAAAAGLRTVADLQGGMTAWTAAHLPVAP